MATLSATYGASPVNDSDATQHNFTVDLSQNTNVAALDNMPSDFDTMDDTAFTIHVECQLSGAIDNDTYELLAGIRKTGSGTHLAGATASTNKQIDANVTHTTWTTFNIDVSGANGYVDTAATKADWDAADVWVEQNYSKTKGGDGLRIEVRRVWITGNYTTASTDATATPAVVAGVGSVEAPTARAGELHTYDYEGGTDGNNITTSDTGSGDQFDTVVLPFVYDNAQAMHGSLAGVTTQSNGGTAELRWTGLDDADVALRAYVRFTSVAPSSNCNILQFRTSGGTRICSLLLNTSGQVAARDTTDTVISGTAIAGHAISADTWYRIEAIVEVDTTTTGRLRYAIYTGDSGTPITTEFDSSTENFGTANIDRVYYGKLESTPTWSGSKWLDDVAAESFRTTYIGAASNPNATATPAVVTGLGTVEAPTVSGSVALTASLVTGLGSVESPTVAIEADITAATVEAVGEVPAPTVAVDVTATPATVEGVGEVLAPTVSAGTDADVTASLITGLGSVEAPTTISTGSTVTASVLTGVGSVAATADIETPLNVVATADGHSAIDLTWDAVSFAISYQIERDSSIIASDIGATSYNDTPLSSNTSYDYRVRAFLGGRGALVAGVDVPTKANTGVLPGVTRTTYAGPTTITSQTTIENKNITSQISVETSASVIFRNCLFEFSGVVNSNQGMLQCTNASVSDVYAEDCTFRPTWPTHTDDNTAGGHNEDVAGVRGHHFTLVRCQVVNTADCVRIVNTNDNTGPVNVTVQQCWLGDMVYWRPDSLGRTEGQHLDVISIESGQGGTGTTILGNYLEGFMSPDHGDGGVSEYTGTDALLHGVRSQYEHASFPTIGGWINAGSGLLVKSYTSGANVDDLTVDRNWFIGCHINVSDVNNTNSGMDDFALTDNVCGTEGTINAGKDDRFGYVAGLTYDKSVAAGNLTGNVQENNDPATITRT